MFVCLFFMSCRLTLNASLTKTKIKTYRIASSKKTHIAYAHEKNTYESQRGL